MMTVVEWLKSWEMCHAVLLCTISISDLRFFRCGSQILQMHIQSLEDLYKFNLLTGSINELIYVMLGTH